MNQSLSWNHVNDLESLGHIEALLGRLQSTLDKELSAVARFDFQDIERIDGEKRELVVELTGFMQSKSGQPALAGQEVGEAERELKRRVVLATGHVRAMIHANSALLGEAIMAITAKLGIDARPQSYDRRARSVVPSRRASSTSA